MLKQGERCFLLVPHRRSIDSASSCLPACREHPADADARCRGAGSPGCPLRSGSGFELTENESQTVPIDSNDLIFLEDSSVDKCTVLSLCSRQYQVDVHPSCPQIGFSPHFTWA